MPASPLLRTRAYNHLKWLYPSHRFDLRETEGLCAAWMDNEPKASFIGQSWEEVMKQAVRETWKSEG